MADNRLFVVTRRTCDIYMALFLQALLLITGYHAWQTRNLLPVFISPLVCLPLWVPLRLAIPRGGIPSRSIRHESPLLQFWTGWLVLFAIVGFYDSAVHGHHKDDPVRISQVVTWACLFTLFFGGTALICRWWPPQRNDQDLPRTDSTSSNRSC